MDGKCGGHVTVDPSTGLKRFSPYFNLGAVCRATLYTLCAYRNTFHREYFSPPQLTFIVHCAAAESVSDWERHRNEELCRYQGNRNPFIDFPEWAQHISFGGAFQQFDGR